MPGRRPQLSRQLLAAALGECFGDVAPMDNGFAIDFERHLVEFGQQAGPVKSGCQALPLATRPIGQMIRRLEWLSWLRNLELAPKLLLARIAPDQLETQRSGRRSASH